MSVDRRPTAPGAFRFGRRARAALCALLWSSALVAALASGARAAPPTSVRVEVGPNPVGTNERLGVSIVIEGEKVSDAQVSAFPVVEGLRRIGGASTSESTSLVFGTGGARSTSTRTIGYNFLPERVGTVTIPPLDVTVGGKTYRTEPQVVQVVADSGNPRRPGGRSRSADPFDSFFQDPFGNGRARTGAVDIPEMTIRRTLSRDEAYLGEAVRLTVELWVGPGDGHIEQAGPVNGTDRTGFWVENLKVDSRATGRTQEQGGRVFTVFTVTQQLLYATEPGTVTLPVETWRVVYRPSVLSLLSPAQEIFAKSTETPLTIRPLPESGRPAGFSGLVGRFRVRSDIDRRDAKVGDAVTWKVTLDGQGNLRTAGELPVPKPGGFEVFSSKANDDVHATDRGLAGSRVSELVLIPRSAGKLAVPALRIPFFDPEAQAYRFAETAGHEVEVSGAADAAATAAVAASPAVAGARPVQQATDIRYIRTASGGLAPERPWSSSVTFWAIALGAPLASGLAWGRRRRQLAHGRDPLSARRRQALARLERALRAVEGEDAAALAQVAAALVAFLGDRFGIPSVDLTAARIRARAADWKLPPPAAEELVSVLAELDAARFGGGRGGVGEVRERVLALARALAGGGR